MSAWNCVCRIIINQILPKYIFVNLLHFSFFRSPGRRHFAYFLRFFFKIGFPWPLCDFKIHSRLSPISWNLVLKFLNPETLPPASTKRKWACHFTPSFILTWHQTGKSGQRLSNFCGQRRKIQKQAVERTIPQRVLATASQAIISSQTQPHRQSTKSLFLVSSQTQTKISTTK